MKLRNRARLARSFTGTAFALVIAGVGCQDITGLLPPEPVTGGSNSVAQVFQPNTPPVADAGVDLSVEAGALVVLNGSASDDADADRLSYSWIQVEGEPQVELKGVFSSLPRFDAPAEVAAETKLTFRLTVVDGFAFHTDEITVTIRPAN